jgi:hypothetical protein
LAPLIEKSSANNFPPAVVQVGAVIEDRAKMEAEATAANPE